MIRGDSHYARPEAMAWLERHLVRYVFGLAGTKGERVSHFTHDRIRPAQLAGCGVRTAPQRDSWRSEPWPELTVLAEWPDGEAEPTRIWLDKIPADTPLEHLVHLAKLHWRIERAKPQQDWLELEQELGLSHYEGRGWRGFLGGRMQASLISRNPVPASCC